MPNKLDTLWYTRCPVPTGLGIAIQKGWLEETFRAQGVKLASIMESNDSSVRESHFSHTVRNSVRHGGNIPAIGARALDRDTRALGLSWADEVQLIVVQPGSKIRSVRDLKGSRFGIPKWKNVEVDFARAMSLRGLENALSLEGLAVKDVELVDYVRENKYGDEGRKNVGGILVVESTGGGARRQNAEIVGLLRGEVDAIYLKGAQGVELVHLFGLRPIIDTGSHPDPLIRANNGTPRTLTVDAGLLEHHFDVAVAIVEQVLRAEAWAQEHPDETRLFLARETNTNEYYARTAYGEDAQKRLRTDLAEESINGLQHFTDFLARWEFIPKSFSAREWIDVRPFEAAQRQKVAV
jgi:ABC-type nitrate/sulfonate/bicarbonate transport system substrate-binding protein